MNIAAPSSPKNKESGKSDVNYAPPDNMELDHMLPPIGAVKKLKESAITNPTT